VTFFFWDSQKMKSRRIIRWFASPVATGSPARLFIRHCPVCVNSMSHAFSEIRASRGYSPTSAMQLSALRGVKMRSGCRHIERDPCVFGIRKCRVRRWPPGLLNALRVNRGRAAR
jgi:hypothetical protein